MWGYSWPILLRVALKNGAYHADIQDLKAEGKVKFSGLYYTASLWSITLHTSQLSGRLPNFNGIMCKLFELW